MASEIISLIFEQFSSAELPALAHGNAMLNGDHAPVLRGLDQMSLLSDDYLPLVADVIRSASAGRQNEVISACKSDPEVAQNIMTGLQKWLDDNNPDPAMRRNAIYLLVKISRAVDQLPRSLFLHEAVDSGATITTGGTCVIYLGTMAKLQVVMKRPKGKDSDETALLQRVLAREALVWRQLKHPNLLSLLGLRRTEDDQTDLISPYVQDGTLRDFLARSGSISINQRDALLHGIADGLAYLHSLNMIHGDIKDLNVLIDRGKALLCDFGVSIVGQCTVGRMTTEHYARSHLWAGPELEAGVRLTTAFDVFSFAYLCYMMCTGEHPWDLFWKRASKPKEAEATKPTANEFKQSDVTRLVVKGYRPQLPPAAEQCIVSPMTERLENLVKICWAQKPQERPTMIDVKATLASGTA